MSVFVYVVVFCSESQLYCRGCSTLSPRALVVFVLPVSLLALVCIDCCLCSCSTLDCVVRQLVHELRKGNVVAQAR